MRAFAIHIPTISILVSWSLWLWVLSLSGEAGLHWWYYQAKIPPESFSDICSGKSRACVLAWLWFSNIQSWESKPECSCCTASVTFFSLNCLDCHLYQMVFMMATVSLVFLILVVIFFLKVIFFKAMHRCWSFSMQLHSTSSQCETA